MVGKSQGEEEIGFADWIPIREEVHPVQLGDRPSPILIFNVSPGCTDRLGFDNVALTESPDQVLQPANREYNNKKGKQVQGGTATVHRSKGADGITDRTVTGPKGKTQTIDRSRGGDGAVDATVTGRKGGTSTVDRSKGADGVTDRVVTGPGGKTQTIDRTRGTDGAIDATITGRQGGSTAVDRSRNGDGTTDATIVRK